MNEPTNVDIYLKNLSPNQSYSELGSFYWISFNTKNKFEGSNFRWIFTAKLVSEHSSFMQTIHLCFVDHWPFIIRYLWDTSIIGIVFCWLTFPMGQLMKISTILHIHTSIRSVDAIDWAQIRTNYKLLLMI